MLFSFMVNTCIHHTSALHHYITVHAVVEKKTKKNTITVVQALPTGTLWPIYVALESPFAEYRCAISARVFSISISLRHPLAAARIPGFCTSGRCTSGRRPPARGWTVRIGTGRRRWMRRGCMLGTVVGVES